MLSLIQLVLLLIAPIMVGVITTWIIITSWKNAEVDFRIRRENISEMMNKKKFQIIIFIILNLVPLIFGLILFFILLTRNEVELDYQERAISLSTWIYFITATISMIAQTILISTFMKDFIKEKESSPQTSSQKLYNTLQNRNRERNVYSSSVVIYTIPQTISTFGLLIAILCLTYSGVLDNEPNQEDENGTSEIDENTGKQFEINEKNIDDVTLGTRIFLGLSMISVISGILPTLKKGPVMEKNVFRWRVALSVIGTIPCIIGFLIWVLLMGL